MPIRNKYDAINVKGMRKRERQSLAKMKITRTKHDVILVPYPEVFDVLHQDALRALDSGKRYLMYTPPHKGGHSSLLGTDPSRLCMFSTLAVLNARHESKNYERAKWHEMTYKKGANGRIVEAGTIAVPKQLIQIRYVARWHESVWLNKVMEFCALGDFPTPYIGEQDEYENAAEIAGIRDSERVRANS